MRDATPSSPTVRRGPADPAGLNLRHHGDDELAPGLVDLAVNVRPGGPPPWLRRVLADTLTGLSEYPRPHAAREAVAARHHRRQTDVLITAGAAEAFTLIARAFRFRHPVVIHPQFTEPELVLRTAGHPVDRVLLSAVDGFALPDGALPPTADLVVVGNPTNPTSTLHAARALAALARPGRLLLVDEAFMDVVPGETESLAGAAEIPGLIVVRSLTKMWGLAGLRVGYLLAAPEIITALAAVQPHWSVSTPALAAAVACSSPAAVAEAQVAAARVTVDRAYLLECLAAFDGVEVIGLPSAPFVLLRVRDGDTIRRRLRDCGFAVRRGDSFPGLGPDWLRLAVRDPHTTDAFCAALATVQLEAMVSGGPA
jgi:histidinol-phosphate aminotransferase